MLCLCPGGALTGVGEALQQVGKARDELDANVKCTFVDPLQHLHKTELKGIKVRSLYFHMTFPLAYVTQKKYLSLSCDSFHSTS